MLALLLHWAPTVRWIHQAPGDTSEVIAAIIQSCQEKENKGKNGLVFDKALWLEACSVILQVVVVVVC